MLQYMPIYGSILLTIIIVWIVASTIVGNRRKIGQAVAGSYFRSTCCGATTTPIGWTEEGWTSGCDECGTWQYLGDDHDNPPPGFQADGRPEVTSEEPYYPVKKARAAAHIARAFGDEGEPLPTPAMPNIGGEGHPDYQGPHYAVPHDRFVPYDMLDEPIPGTAVHRVGDVAFAGPLPAEGDRGHDEAATRREDGDDS
jgi:hypothetical protein